MVAPDFQETVLLLDPGESAREKGTEILEQLGYRVRTATDSFEGLALVDGISALIAVHPDAAELYPRLRSSGIPLITVFASRTDKPKELAQQIGADAFVFRP